MVNTVIFGKVNDIRYKVEKDSYDRPQVVRKVELNHNEEILRFEGVPHYNSRSNGIFSYACYGERLNISENEEVEQEKKVFRPDLNEIHIFTNKIISEFEDTEEKARVEEEVKQGIAAFNKKTIEDNEKMKKYCDLHRLDHEVTDPIELANLIYGKGSWALVEGKIVTPPSKGEIYLTTASSCSYTSFDSREPLW